MECVVRDMLVTSIITICGSFWGGRGGTWRVGVCGGGCGGGGRSSPTPATLRHTPYLHPRTSPPSLHQKKGYNGHLKLTIT